MRIHNCIKRLAAAFLGRGVNSIRIKPDRIDKISSIRTRAEVKRYCMRGEIYAKRVVGSASTPTRRRIVSGTHNARINRAREYVIRTRFLRALLREHRNSIDATTYRRNYLAIKSGVIRTRRALLAAIPNK